MGNEFSAKTIFFYYFPDIIMISKGQFSRGDVFTIYDGKNISVKKITYIFKEKH